jgi:L-alanine-DL-glutamate epimerase-like enolase superfamily enzyme
VHRLEQQLSGWVDAGIPRVKMKVGRDEAADLVRVRAARKAIGEQAELFVDANGAWTAAVALRMARQFEAYRVSWFEEPVSSDDLPGLRRVRDHLAGRMEVAAGEYGYEGAYFLHMLNAGAVDVLQADATRCGGVSGFLQAAALCDAFGVPLSAHTAPSLHATLCCAAPRIRHAEYFHDHVRIEELLFEGVPRPHDGTLRPDPSRAGLGLTFKRQDAARFKVG